MSLRVFVITVKNRYNESFGRSKKFKVQKHIERYTKLYRYRDKYDFFLIFENGSYGRKSKFLDKINKLFAAFLLLHDGIFLSL